MTHKVQIKMSGSDAPTTIKLIIQD